MNIYEQQGHNKKLTIVIMLVFFAFFVFLGMGLDYFYGAFNPAPAPQFRENSQGYYEAEIERRTVPYFTIGALMVASFMVFNSALSGHKMVLKSAMARRAVSADFKEKQFMNVVGEMATASGLPAPMAYVIPDSDLNAFAAGFSSKNSCIAVTEGLLEKLNREELQGVVAHEMSHVRNYDIRLMTVVAALIGAVALISDFGSRMLFFGRSRKSSSRSSGGGGPLILVFFVLWILGLILAPLVSRILAMAISRQREYLADASAAELTRNPKALVSALEKIRRAVSPTKRINNGVAHMCITDPRGSLIEEKSGFMADLLATHPPMEKRILALKVMAYQKG